MLTKDEDHGKIVTNVSGDYNEIDIVFTDLRQKLSEIRKSGVQMAIWQRRLSADLQAWLELLDVACLPDLRILVRPSDLKSALGELLNECSMPDDEMRLTFVEDIDKLVSLFAEITRKEYVDVRLQSIDNDACWKFHRDTVKMRLLTTYVGPSTEWVNQRDAEEALFNQKDYQGLIERFHQHEVGIFKGSEYDDGNGIVHRSPPIAGKDCNRLLLCLNQPSDISPDPWI